jgi:hypothetical protein
VAHNCQPLAIVEAANFTFVILSEGAPVIGAPESKDLLLPFLG